MFDRDAFENKKRDDATRQGKDVELQQLAARLVAQADSHGYGYQWTWLGMPVIQLPADVIAVQEIIWRQQPDVIIETGIAWGGSIVFHASILHLVGKGKVIGIDVVLPEKNRAEIVKYPFSDRITLIEGSSTDQSTVEAVKSHICTTDSVMVILDSNHAHDHVLNELRRYGPLVTQGQFLIVADTVVENLPKSVDRPRPWGPGNNPMTAMLAYLDETDRFEPDSYYNDKVLVTYFPKGYLRCVA